MNNWIVSLVIGSTGIGFGARQKTAAYQFPPSRSSIAVQVDPGSGSYSIILPGTSWKLAGTVRSGLSHVKKRRGRDRAGTFQEISFEWNSGSSLRGTIRRYDTVPVVWFRVHYLDTRENNGIVFPKFDSFPAGLNTFSYQDRTFAPPTFGLAQTSTPWLFFDSQANSLLLSPASNFMVAKMVGDEESSVGVGLNSRLTRVPAGLDQDSLVVASSGIGNAWDAWGSALRGLYRREIPKPSSEVILEKLGYWTDNGADYYYNYDPDRGYAQTLLDLKRGYQKEDLPLGYLQLDSWWYSKSADDPSGKPGGTKKNSKLPEESWNRYGGLMEYRAHPALFPRGLAYFQRQLGLPLVVHNRWIDRKSPYHDRYQISGIGAVDPLWWSDVMNYLSSAGVNCYEQDWLDPIYANSPDMSSTVGPADAFTDGMADAAAARHLTLQYCMATPRFFLQGVKYPNLTTIRTSGDRFEPRKWADFLYVSQLAQSVGIWPWCDVFKSSETGNMILSVLSGGPVGTGDGIGKQSKENILKAVLPDGVIVKPDRAIVPCDQTYLDGAGQRTNPFVASTYTDHAGLRTTYLFAFPRSKTDRNVALNLTKFGAKFGAYIYDFNTDKLVYHSSDSPFQTSIGSDGYAYLMFVPETSEHIELLGDLGKFVPTGKQRISKIEDRDRGAVCEG